MRELLTAGVGLCCKKDARLKREWTGKIKTELGTRIASRLSLVVEATGLEPAASCSQSKHSTKLSYASIPVNLSAVTLYNTIQKKSTLFLKNFTPEMAPGQIICIDTVRAQIQACAAIVALRDFSPRRSRNPVYRLGKIRLLGNRAC